MTSSDSQIDKPQRGRPKRAELPDVNINTGAQSINAESFFKLFPVLLNQWDGTLSNRLLKIISQAHLFPYKSLSSRNSLPLLSVRIQSNFNAISISMKASAVTHIDSLHVRGNAANLENNKIFLHENRSQFPEEKNSFVLSSRLAAFPQVQGGYRT